MKVSVAGRYSGWVHRQSPNFGNDGIANPCAHVCGYPQPDPCLPYRGSAFPAALTGEF